MFNCLLLLFFFSIVTKICETTPVCENKDSNCMDVLYPQCLENRKWMSENCAKQCGFCGNCTDSDRRCALYRRGRCYKDDPWFLTYCKEKCKFCAANDSAGYYRMCINKFKKCTMYTYDKCILDGEWMSENCAKYCGFCGLCKNRDANCVNYEICNEADKWAIAKCKKACKYCDLEHTSSLSEDSKTQITCYSGGNTMSFCSDYGIHCPLKIGLKFVWSGERLDWDLQKELLTLTSEDNVTTITNVSQNQVLNISDLSVQLGRVKRGGNASLDFIKVSFNVLAVRIGAVVCYSERNATKGRTLVSENEVTWAPRVLAAHIANFKSDNLTTATCRCDRGWPAADNPRIQGPGQWTSLGLDSETVDEGGHLLSSFSWWAPREELLGAESNVSCCVGDSCKPFTWLLHLKPQVTKSTRMTSGPKQVASTGTPSKEVTKLLRKTSGPKMVTSPEMSSEKVTKSTRMTSGLKLVASTETSSEKVTRTTRMTSGPKLVTSPEKSSEDVTRSKIMTSGLKLVASTKTSSEDVTRTTRMISGPNLVASTETPSKEETKSPKKTSGPKVVVSSETPSTKVTRSPRKTGSPKLAAITETSSEEVTRSQRKTIGPKLVSGTERPSEEVTRSPKKTIGPKLVASPEQFSEEVNRRNTSGPKLVAISEMSLEEVTRSPRMTSGPKRVARTVQPSGESKRAPRVLNAHIANSTKDNRPILIATCLYDQGRPPKDNPRIQGPGQWTSLGLNWETVNKGGLEHSTFSWWAPREKLLGAESNVSCCIGDSCKPFTWLRHGPFLSFAYEYAILPTIVGLITAAGVMAAVLMWRHKKTQDPLPTPMGPTVGEHQMR